jgi:hypothetical protein
MILISKCSRYTCPCWRNHRYLAENVKLRFNVLRRHATDKCVFENQFSVEESRPPEKLQLELLELQYDSILRSSFNQEALLTFYASLPVSRLSEFRKLARNLANVVGSTYTREEDFHV